MKILLVPDIHLGVKSFGKDNVGKLNSRIIDQFELLNFVYDQGVENNIDRMILSGDIFDKEEPEPVLISMFFEWLSKCTDHFYVDIVLGNHDYKRNGKEIITILDSIPAARFKQTKVYKQLTTTIYEKDSLAITYIPFTDRDEMGFEKNSDAVNSLCENIDLSLKQSNGQLCKQKIAVGHLSIENSIYVGDEICNEYKELFLPTSAFELFDFTWMGHIHNPQVLSTKPFVAHIGSLDRKSFSEKEKYITLYDSEKQDYVDIQLPCRNLIDVSIEIPENIQNTTEYVKEQLEQIENYKDAIVRVQVNVKSHNAQGIDKKEIAKLLETNKVQNVASIIEKKATAVIVNDKEDEITETLLPKHALKKCVAKMDLDPNLEKDVIDFCLSIIDENDNSTGGKE